MDTTDLVIIQGKTFDDVIRYAAKPFIWKDIASIALGAPTIINLSSAHGMPDGWPVAVVGTNVSQLNVETAADDENDQVPERWYKGTVVDNDSISLNGVPSWGFDAFVAGAGSIVFYTPVDLAGGVVRMTVKDRVGGTVLASWSSTTGEFALDNTLKTITFAITDTVTAALTWLRGVYEIEFEDSLGRTSPVLDGRISVKREIAT